ncbi:GNAT family N-acetyltransferase [Marinobacteraceae bacterium S3BR75-40.1]
MIELVAASDTFFQFAETLVVSHLTPFYQASGVDWSPAQFREHWAHSQNFMLHVDHAVVGFVSLMFTPRVLTIRDIELASRYQRQGIGRWTVGRLEQWAAEQDRERIRANVLSSNPARLFYERLGFEPIGKDDDIVQLEKVVKA